VQTNNELQPGFTKHLRPIPPAELTSSELIRRVKLDHPTAIWLPANTDKVLTFCSTRCISISHKPGGSNVSQVDASANYILNVKKADWDYRQKNGLYYNDYVGMFCMTAAADQTLETPDHIIQC
jgi:hypothetical protein